MCKLYRSPSIKCESLTVKFYARDMKKVPQEGKLALISGTGHFSPFVGTGLAPVPTMHTLLRMLQ
jgi:hypothetical protein